MNIRKHLFSILLCAALLLSIVPASVIQAEEGTPSIAAKTVEVTVKAIRDSDGEEVTVEDAVVTITRGDTVLITANTDARGVARLSLDGLTEDDLRNATAQAYKTVDREKGISSDARDALFQHYAADGGGDYYRYEYQLHSETIDADGNWLGKEVPIPINAQADIVFVIDGTGSMEDDLEHIKEELKYFLQYLGNEEFDVRYSVVEFRDYHYGELPVLHEQDGTHWFTDADTVLAIVNGIEADGGGDTWEESLFDTIHWPLVSDEMDYRDDALRFAFLITDADTSVEMQGGSFYMEPETDLAEKNIITSVIAEEEFQEEVYFKNIYEKTGGAFMGITWPGICYNMFDVVANHVNAETVEMELTLSEPRMLYNISLCYLADDATSQSDSYLEAVKHVLNVYAQDMAQTTDGHVLIDKVIVFSTDSLINFMDKTYLASMADIRIQTRESDSNTIHSNGSVNGFYRSDTRNSSNDIGNFDNNPGVDVAGRENFCRIQMSGTEGAGWDNSLIDRPDQFATTMMHESGHYIFGFWDEYLDQDYTNWRNKTNMDKPYGLFGLMDNQHTDIELSKDHIEYAYLGSYYGDKTLATTYHYRIYRESCESVLADLLEKGKTDKDKETTFLPLIQLFDSPYRAKYTLAMSTSPGDRHAAYPYAGLDDSDYIILDRETNMDDTAGNSSDTGNGSIVSQLSEHFSIDASDETVMEAPEALGSIHPAGAEDAFAIDVEEDQDVSYALFVHKMGEQGFAQAELTRGEDGLLNADLTIPEGDLAQIVIARESGGKVSYNTYYIDRSEPAEGYMYTSADGKVMAYGTSEEETAYTFIADNTSYENDEYASLNQGTHVYAGGARMTGGEIYSVASCTADVDYTSICWFKYDGETWSAIPTDLTLEETFNIGARADLDGEGLYVLMGREAADNYAEAPSFLIYEPSETVDAQVAMSFDDYNENTKFYFVYYTEVTEEDFEEEPADLNEEPEDELDDEPDEESEDELDDEPAEEPEEEPDEDQLPENAVLQVYPVDDCEQTSETERTFTLQLPERNHMYRVYVMAVLEDGSRSAMSSMLMMAPEADRDGDGIPDWFMNQYHLWPDDETDISGNDPDHDGRTNLEEYLAGTDPTVPD